MKKQEAFTEFIDKNNNTENIIIQTSFYFIMDASLQVIIAINTKMV